MTPADLLDDIATAGAMSGKRAPKANGKAFARGRPFKDWVAERPRLALDLV